MKDSFRSVMTLVAYFDLELHHMDVKTMFLNNNIDETINMLQLENFVSRDPKKMVFKLKCDAQKPRGSLTNHQPTEN